MAANLQKSGQARWHFPPLLTPPARFLTVSPAKAPCIIPLARPDGLGAGGAGMQHSSALGAEPPE